jgi:solute carrier family 25 protein 38
MYFATLSFTRQVLAAAMNISPTSRRQDSHSALPALPAQLNLVAGGFSRVTVGFLMMPISVVKVRYESNLYEYRSIWHALTSIVQRDGYRGLFYGYGSTALRDAPFAGLYVLFYEHCKQLLLAADFPSPLINTSSAVVAGSVATAITHPFDVIRTQIQLKPRLYPNTLTAVRLLYAEAGWRAYLVGMVPRLTRKTLSAAITWTLFEELVKALQ